MPHIFSVSVVVDTPRLDAHTFSTRSELMSSPSDAEKKLFFLRNAVQKK